MKSLDFSSYRQAIEHIIFKRSPSLREFCNKNSNLISHATLSRVLRKFKNGKYVGDTSLSDEKFFKLLKDENLPTNELLYLYLLKKQEELKPHISHAHPLNDTFKDLLKSFSQKNSAPQDQLELSEDKDVVEVCLQLLPEKLKKSVYLEVLKKIDYYRQGSSLQSRFKNISSLRQKLKEKIEAL